MRCVLQVPRQIALSMTLRMNLMTVMGTMVCLCTAWMRLLQCKTCTQLKEMTSHSRLCGLCPSLS